MSDLPYLVAGGGIAGLAAALALARGGKPVRLFEQAQAFEEVGAGLQMSPNGVRALRALGAWDAVEPSCVIPSEIHVRDGIGGGVLQRIRLGKRFEQEFGAPYRVCHRADLLAGLVSAASANPAIELNTAAAAVAARPDGCLDLGSGGSVTGQAVIAADGIRSRLREEICGRVEPAHRGHVIYRALIPLAAVPPEIEADCVTLWLCPGGHVVHYPVSDWRNFNIAAAVDGTRPEGGWSVPAAAVEVGRHFTRACDDLGAVLKAPLGWLSWPGADLPDLANWSKGSLVLAGDAAHATLPYLAQGAVMALEDAVELARLAGAAPSLPEAFRRFETLRKPRTSRIQAQSRRQGRIYHARGLMAAARNAVLRSGGSAFALNRARWIYEWQPGAPSSP